MMFSDNNYNDDLRLAHFIADIVDSKTLNSFKDPEFISVYPTVADAIDSVESLAEQTILKQLSQTRPRDSVHSNNLSDRRENYSRFWLISPLCCADNFVRKIPVWATIISLVVDSVPVVGLVSAPALNKRWWAGQGSGAYTGRTLAHAKKMRVSGVGFLQDSVFSYSDIDSWQDSNSFDSLLKVKKKVWRSVSYEDFWAYCMLAEGSIDIVASPRSEANNIAALLPIISEAGGSFTSFQGENDPYRGSLLATNGLLHQDILDNLR